MRPLVHPAIEDVPLEAILHALADPTRVRIFADIVHGDCAQSCTALSQFACKPIPKSTLSQHFKILREAGLIRSERHGVEMRNTPRSLEVDARYPGLLAAIGTAYEIQMADQARRDKGAARAERADAKAALASKKPAKH